MTSFRTQMRYFTPYELHKIIINEYVLKKPGDTKLLEKDTKCKDKTDYHVIKEHHRFLWDDNEKPSTWEEQFARRYYEKLFKEYCIADLSRYKENKVALRWRIEKELVSGKGQFTCGNKACRKTNHLRSWEVNFVYQEKQERRNALVKIILVCDFIIPYLDGTKEKKLLCPLLFRFFKGLCRLCSKKLNYYSKKREVKRLQKKSKYKEKGDAEASCSKSKDHTESMENSRKPSTSNCEVEQMSQSEAPAEESAWASHKPTETKSREEEMEEYLQDLLL